MKRFYCNIFVLLAVGSCISKQENSSNHDSTLSKSIAPPSTAYKFPELKIPDTFHFDTISIYDSILRSRYDAHYLQSSLPQMKIFNRAIRNAMKARIQLEQSYADTDNGNVLGDPVFTYDLKPIEFYSDGHIISITHIADTYAEGANHHNYAWFTFNFDLKKNERIRFQDVFNLQDQQDSVAFIESVYQHKIEDCMDWNMPFDSVDFSFTTNAIYINPELSWACALNRSLLPMDSLRKYIKGRWMKK
jgi:hypothetical protein